MKGKNYISCNLTVEGTVLSMPAQLFLEMEHQQICLAGSVTTDNIQLKKLVGKISKEAEKLLAPCMDKLEFLLPEKVSFYYKTNQCVLCFCLGEKKVALSWQGKEVSLLCGIQTAAKPKKNGIDDYISMIAGELGVKELFFAFQSGKTYGLSKMAEYVLGEGKKWELPSPLLSYKLLFYGAFSFSQDTVIGKALDALFKIKNVQLDLFVAVDNGVMGMVRIPMRAGDAVKAKELYIGLEIKQEKVRFMLRGSFEISLLQGVEFQVGCELSNQGFFIEAFAKMSQPKHLFHTFSIGDTCLSIGYSNGLSFQMFSNLYMGKIKMFGALGITVVLEGMTIDLLSAAVTDVTLPVFVESVLGKPISGLEEFDFIQLLGLPFQHKDTLPNSSNLDKEHIVSWFNNAITEKSFALDAAKVQTEPFLDGVIIVDKKRMRHYFLNKQGKVQLQAQFYYAVKDMSLGDYTITKGIFLCGTIRLFQKIEIQALFSLSEEAGVIAYACVRNFDLGFLKISASGLGAGKDNPLKQLPATSVVRQFVNDNEKGAVFFLRAGKSETSFYFDGKLVLLGLFEMAARILYTKGLIAVDVRFALGSSIWAVLQLKANYQSFSSGQFSFRLVIDCTGLEKNLRQVQKKIDDAINQLRDKINSAKRKLTEAQRHVDELYGEINSLDRKIENCKNDIRKAKWYQFWIPIAKGAEIAAYEVAKVGIYAAIGVAKAALEVAKQVVALGGKIGEGVLKAVNAAIDVTLNLFFVRYISLEANLSSTTKNFKAEIEFVALGKTYHYKTEIGHTALAKDPAAALGDNMSKTMEGDLKNIENGSFKSNRRRYQHQEYTIAQHKERLEAGMQQLDACTRMMCKMQKAYVKECKTPMAEYQEMNVAYQQAVNQVAGVLEVADRTTDFETMNQAVSMLEQEMQEKKDVVRDTSYMPVKEAVTDYKEALDLLKMIQEGMEHTEQQAAEMEKHSKQIEKQEANYRKECVKQGVMPEGDMVKVINNTEEIMYQEFPVTRNRKEFINLSREKLIHQYLDHARDELQGEPTENIKKMRTRAVKGKYENRL